MACAVDIIRDGGFETGGIPSTIWNNPQTSTNFGTPLCDLAGCGNGAGASPPRTGAIWAWFGGATSAETATLGQSVTIPAGTASLRFWMRIGTVTAPFTDVLNVRVDGVTVQTYTEPAVAEAAYTERVIDLTAFANGASHNITFEYIGTTTGTGSFVVDDVSLIAGSGCATPTPSGTPTNTPTPVGSGTFTNNAPICTTLGGTGAPYPSTITVSGGPIQIDGIRVAFFGLYHVLPDNLDALLVGPQGQEYILMGDAGGAIPINQNSPVDLTFSDAAGQVLPDSAPLTTGTFLPTNWETPVANFAAPGPPGPYIEPGSTVIRPQSQTLSGTFRLSNANGVWSLYIRDDGGTFSQTAITGCLNGGWQLQFIPTTAANASISGRVTTADGRGISNAKVVITGNALAQPRIATTGSFGYYTFDGLATGETYVVTVNSKRFTFSSPSQVFSLVDNIADANFTADPLE